MWNSLGSTWKSRSDSGGALEGGAPFCILPVFSQHTLSDHSAWELVLGKTENLLCVSRLVVYFGDAKYCGALMGSHLGILGRGAIVHQIFAV